MYADFGNGSPTEISSNQGWSQFGDWADDLDAAEFGEIVHLWEHGWAQNIKTLSEQLAKAIEGESTDGDVKTIVQWLIELLEGESVIVITDGFAKSGENVAKSKEYNPDQPRAEDGKWGPQDNLAGTSANKVQSLADHVRKLPAAIAAKVKEKVRATYSKLESRYGKKTAILILGAGLAGVPLPIPGSSLIAAAPFLAAAELYLKFGSSKSVSELSQDEIGRLGKEFMDELMQGWNEGKEKSLTILDLAAQFQAELLEAMA